jgi:hypothetical protein
MISNVFDEELILFKSPMSLSKFIIIFTIIHDKLLWPKLKPPCIYYWKRLIVKYIESKKKLVTIQIECHKVAIYISTHGHGHDLNVINYTLFGCARVIQVKMTNIHFLISTKETKKGLLLS